MLQRMPLPAPLFKPKAMQRRKPPRALPPRPLRMPHWMPLPRRQPLLMPRPKHAPQRQLPHMRLRMLLLMQRRKRNPAHRCRLLPLLKHKPLRGRPRKPLLALLPRLNRLPRPLLNRMRLRKLPCTARRMPRPGPPCRLRHLPRLPRLLPMLLRMPHLILPRRRHPMPLLRRRWWHKLLPAPRHRPLRKPLLQLRRMPRLRRRLMRLPMRHRMPRSRLLRLLLLRRHRGQLPRPHPAPLRRLHRMRLLRQLPAPRPRPPCAPNKIDLQVQSSFEPQTATVSPHGGCFFCAIAATLMWGRDGRYAIEGF